MSTKKSDSLRNALREMRVNEPLRLPKSGPSFRPPMVPQPTGKEAPRSEVPYSAHTKNEVAQTGQPPTEHTQKETPHREQTQFGAAPFEHALNEAAKNKHPQKETAKSERTQDKVPPMKTIHNEVPHSKGARKKQTQNELPQSEGTHSETSQNEEPQIEQPSRGFFRLSDRVFSYPQLQQLSGDCFRLFLWMSSKAWRYQNSDGTLRASVGFIESHTGMSHATISRCLKTLREISLIELQETDFKYGNIWRISPIAFAGCNPDDLPPRSEPPQNGGSRNKAPAPTKRARPSLNLRERPPQTEQQNRNIYKNKKLSQESARPLFERIGKIRAPEKQKSEREGLIRLLETHDTSEIEAALTYVEERGTLSGERCHSPFRYLTMAMDDVMRASEKMRSCSQATLSMVMPSTNAQCPEREDQDTDHRLAAITEFGSLNLEEQQCFIDSYVEREFNWGYTPSEPLLKRLAAFSWYDNKLAWQRNAQAA